MCNALCKSMMRKTRLNPFFGLLLLLSLVMSCKKTEEIVVEGNKPPPDNTLPAGVQENYITKSYIGLLGREPDQAEFDAAMQSFGSGGFVASARKSVINSITAKPDYLRREFELANNDLLNGLDTFQVADIINTFNFLLTQPQYEPFYETLQMELVRLNAYLGTFAQVQNGSISIPEIHRNCVNNYFYDQINMGSLNFVLATFQLLALRNPTQFELDEGVKMTDGLNGILLLQEGDSKDDFLDIFFASEDYYSGQVKTLFTRFLFRNPNSEEAVYYTQLIRQTDGFRKVIAEILSADEYAGRN